MSTPDKDAVHDYLNACLGDTQGRLHIAIGSGGHLTEAGKYAFDNFVGSHFAWPAEADQAVRAMLASAPDSDVYVCPYLMHADKRTPAAAVARDLVHADIDHGGLDLDKVRALDGCFAVASGTLGNGHVYVTLTQSVPANWHKLLCRGLADYLGGGDAKNSANDVLRPPGTFNHKPTSKGGAPTPVQWLVRPSGARSDPRALAQLVGVTLPDQVVAPTAASATVEQFNIDDHPLVRAALKQITNDRSVDTMRVVGACHDSDLTLAQARYAVNTRADLATRLAERHDDDVAECWRKIAESRPNTDLQVRPNGSRFIDPQYGLKARDLMRQVVRSVTCAYGDVDGRFYVYDRGVWTPNNGHIEAVIGYWLDNRYRQSHARNVMDLIRFSPETPRITCDPAPNWINVPNGMIRWSDGTLHAHSPEYLSTVQLPVEYQKTAKCPKFDAYLESSLPEDCYRPTGDSPGFIWELIGYTLFSGNPLHVAIMLYGKGRNGKGVLIRVLKHLLGDRNICTATLHELEENRFRKAGLYGKLANLAGDLDSKWLDSTATFKAITGGDTVQGEYKYGAVFDFAPWALPFYSINKAFGSADSSEGWVARWVVVPFPHSFLGREDRGLDDQLHTDPELQGILARGIAALPALMARGRLPEPTSVRQAKQAFVTSSDAIRSWVDQRCVLHNDDWTPRADLYKAYCLTVFSDGSRRLSAREFYARLEQIGGIAHTKRRGERGMVGIRLRPFADTQTDD